MSLVQYNPWTDAAEYGRGLGSTLGQAFLQMPQQRLQMAMQLAQAKAEQQRQAQQQQLQQAMLGVEQQRALTDKAIREQQLALAQKQYEGAHLKNQQAMIEPRFDKATGQYQGYFDYNDKSWHPGGGGGLGNTNAPKPAVPMTGGQAANDMIHRIAQYAAALGTVGSRDTAHPDLSRIDPGILGLLSNRVYQAQSPQSMTPSLGATNAPAVTNAPGRVLRYNPATGQLE